MTSGLGSVRPTGLHPTQPLVPTGCRTHLPRFGRHHSSGGGAASVPMGMITPFSWQNSLGLDLAGDEELSRSFEPCLNNQHRSCHPERSEASLCPSSQTLRCAQGDKLLPILLVKNHYLPSADVMISA